MYHPVRRGRGVATHLLVAALGVILLSTASAFAQGTHPLAQRQVDQWLAAEENKHLLSIERITPDVYKQRAAILATDARELATQLRGLPRDMQGLIRQQATSLYNVRLVPLREQWKQQLAEKQKADQARDAQRQIELVADAETAGKLQAARTLIRERLQNNQISQADAARADQSAEQQVMALQRKYDAYGVSSRINWGRAFSANVAKIAGTTVADTRVRDRLEDTQSEIGRDAHRASELSLTMQRNQLFVANRAMAPAEAQTLNTAAQTELTEIQARYGPTVASAADFRDRVARLVQAGVAAQRPIWEREAVTAREAAAAQAAAEQQAARAAQVAAAQAAAARATPAQAPVAAPRPAANTPRTQAQRPPTIPGPGPGTGPVVLNRSESTLSWRPIVLLLLVGGGGAGFYVYRGKRKAAPPKFSDVKERYASAAPTPAPPVPMPSGPVTAPPIRPGTPVKERLLAEQRRKYQARYTAAADELTSASMALTQMQPVLAAVHENLQVLSKSLQAQVGALIMARNGNTKSLLIRSALLAPLFTLFKRLGLLLKIVLVVVVLWLVGQARDMIVAGDFPIVLFFYLATVAVLFFVERYFRLKVPMAALKKSADQFKSVRLAYVYADQLAHVTADGGSGLHAIRVRADDKKAAVSELSVPVSAEAKVGPGSFLIAIGDLATYRIDTSGSVSQLSSAKGNSFMDENGDLVSEALGEQESFAAATLPALAEYGQASWRKHKATADLPRLEALVKDVDRLQKVWENTYVADSVFEFLFRRIDMFNMRDSATPAGILLFGDPGNGKAHLAKKIAESISAKFEQINPSKLTTADDITALWEKSRGGEARVLYIANADTAFPRADGAGDSSREALEFIAEWEKHKPADSRVWVVMTATSDQNIHKEIVRQIGKNSKVEITPPDAAGRSMILREACRTHQLGNTPIPEFVVNAIGGASIADLYEIVEAVKQDSSPYKPEERHWKAAIKAVRTDGPPRDETKTWERLVLPAAIKDQLKAACKILQNAQEYKKKGIDVPNILLFGPPGTGKTEIARTIANESGVNFLDAKLADLKAGYTGQSGQAVKAKFAEARAMAPTVLFIDELDGVASKRGSENEDKFTKEIVNQMLAEMDGATRTDRPVFVLGATNLPELIDNAILSRFDTKIEIPAPDEESRREILKRVLREKPLDPALDVDEISAAMAKLTPGMSGRDLLKLVGRAVSKATLAAANPDEIFLTRALLMDTVGEAKPADVDEDARWDSLVVSDQTLAKLKQISTSLLNAEARARAGIEPPRGAILFGPPGTGKTQIAKTLANESGVQFFTKKPSDLKSSYQGGSGKNVRMAFDEARTKAPCILFLDEFESIATARGQSAMNDEMVTEILVQMEGAKKNTKPVFVLAATNRLEQLDQAIVSRFTEQIEVPLPTQPQRERLFNVFLAKYQDVDFDRAAMATELAKRCGDIGGRDIRQLVIRASQEAAQRAEQVGPSERIVLTRADLLKQFAPKGEQVTEDEIQKVWSQIVLKPEVKTSLLSMIRMFNAGDKAAAKGLLLYGPPGTGKTEIARTLAKSTGCKFLEIKPSDLKAGYIGQSGKQVKAVWDKARSFGRCVMFIDECDGVFARRGGTETDAFADEVVTNFLPEWDGASSSGQIWVVGATNRRDRFDDAIVSRFGTPIEIGLPDAAQRVEILKLEMKKLERDVEVPDFVGAETPGFAGRKLAELAKAVCALGAQRGGVTEETWRQALGDPGKKPPVDQGATWDSLILQEATIKRLVSICKMVKNAETLRAQHIDVPRAALLFGPPGTGKTQIARTMANESGLAFIGVGPSDMKAGFTGQSGQKVRELFERARGTAPCILFIDEIESGAASRDGAKSDQFTGEIVNELLTQMDGVKKTTGDVFVLAATNHPSLVDAAVLSRFEERIEIPKPGLDERRRMIKTFIGKRRVDFEVDAVAAQFATMTDGMSGRDLSSVVRRASQQAVQRAMDAGTADQVVITRDDLMDMLSSTGR